MGLKTTSSEAEIIEARRGLDNGIYLLPLPHYCGSISDYNQIRVMFMYDGMTPSLCIYWGGGGGDVIGMNPPTRSSCGLNVGNLIVLPSRPFVSRSTHL